MTTTQQHLTTIAEFMGWEYDGTAFWPAGTIVTGYNHLSFDTMRMVFDKWREETKNTKDERQQFCLMLLIQHTLTDGTPSDCAARLADAIEWWKSVK